MSEDSQRQLFEEVDAVQRRYLRRLHRRHRLRSAVPALLCGLMFGALGSILGRAWEDQDWADVVCASAAAAMLMGVYILAVLKR